MHLVQPVADHWTPAYLVRSCRSPVVGLTTGLRQFLEWTVAEGKRPVLLTPATSRISAHASLAFRDARASWVVRDHDKRVYDGLTGRLLRSFDELWEPPTREVVRHSWLVAGNPERVSAPALSFDLYLHHRADRSVRFGTAADALVPALGGQPVQWWDRVEPTGRPWDRLALIEHMRLAMPGGDRVLADGPDGTYLQQIAARTDTGLIENLRGGVPFTGPAADLEAASSLAAQALADTFDEATPTVGVVSLTDWDAGCTQSFSLRRPEVPVAAVLGPRVVRDLELDLDALMTRHEVTRVGRRRTPGLVVRFRDADRGLWAGLARFVLDLGLDRVLAVSGMERVDGHAG